MARKAIFITGGGSGIGRAVAIRFAAEGWLVGLADVNEGGMAETAALLPPGAAWLHPLDVRDRAAWDAALAAFTATTDGRLDVLFNNAGVGSGGPLVNNEQWEIDTLIDVNFRGVVYGAQAAYRYLAATPGSCLLNTASAAAHYGSSGLAVYSATKFAVRALTEALDGEWAQAGVDGAGIKVRDLLPGFIDTPLLARVVPGTNETSRDVVVAAGLEFTPVEVVAQAAWDAVHGQVLHTLVGKTSRQLAFAARWMPGRVRKRMRGLMGPGKGE
ncbi:SDR family oxidoreductase [Novosphingobium lentum]|uniref:SDR family oxidoreductase n=1 Tax=Novosphingobium lentum TaxID=145287 RepID=UPI00082F4C5C|nr:SDR family oxidoreductase [Novosphingobium lentum]